MHILTVILATIVIFAVLVISHEGGHFAAAKAVGVKVNEFAIGMGPQIFSKQKGDTRYSLRLLPVGGYVAMEGEDKDSEDPRAYNNKPAWAKALIIVAGPAMNFILAVIIFAGLITYSGTSIDPVLDKVIEGQPAYVAGIRAGDTVTAVNGETFEETIGIVYAISDAGKVSDSVVLTVKDADTGEVSDKTIVFEQTENGKAVGIIFGTKHNIFAGFGQAAKLAVDVEVEMIQVLWNIFTGGATAGDVVGPVGIVSIVDQSARDGIFNLIYLAALLSLNLGLINMLPFPALDGGRLLFVFIRKVAGKAISDQLEGKIHFIGIMILFALMIMITFKDVNTFILK